MTPTRAQNRVRKKYGIGIGELRVRMRKAWRTLDWFMWRAMWDAVIDSKRKQLAYDAIDQVAADSVIAAAYREAEKEKEEGDDNGK